MATDKTARPPGWTALGKAAATAWAIRQSTPLGQHAAGALLPLSQFSVSQRRRRQLRDQIP